MDRTEEQMGQDLLVAHRAGNQELARAIAKAIEESRNPPGLVERALKAAVTPFKNAQSTLDKNAALEQDSSPPLRLRENSGDFAAGLHSLVSGIPGYQASPRKEESGRMNRFRQEHPVASVLLPLAGAGAKPAMIPAAQASYFPQAASEAALPAAMQTLSATPAQGVGPGMRAMAETLEGMPKVPWDLGKTALGGGVLGSVLPKVGGAKGMALSLALKAAENWGPGAGATALRGGAAVADAIPVQAGTSALQMIRALAEEKQRRSSQQADQ